ncbi:zinc transporter ZntB [Chromatocurvus halotolerans]|uniref:Zinc transporter n=1 Tax=Chromatocurvus halotolerans TaxID=1132028 RepID=A0A4R2KZ69_9GAMM|nr:zinc transporter ZntB [Chromatocurvus halotolerans]TCO76676.1 zinc transporter [Chromatocurvus halotolerans]
MAQPDSEQPDGLIHALLLDGAGAARTLEWREVGAWQPEQGCLWLHFNYEAEASRRWLDERSGLIDVAVNGLVMDETRPRTITRGDNLLMALRGVNLNPGSDPEDMVSLRLWCNGQKVISTCRRPLLSTHDILERLQDGAGPHNAAELLVAWIDGIVARMADTVDGFEDAALELEDVLLTGQLGSLRHDLAHLRKQTITVRRYLAPQREAFNRLTAEAIGWIDDLNRLRLREITDRQIRHIEDIDAVRERTAVAQDEMVGRLSEQMNERMYVLSLVAAIFLPLGFFTGLMGINVGGMPGVEDGFAFWVVVLLCVGAAGLLMAWFRFRRWL